MEMVAEANILIVNQFCDNCKNGIMEYNSKMSNMCHIGYPHKCNECGFEKNYPVRYPYQTIVPVEAFRKPVGKEIKIIKI